MLIKFFEKEKVFKIDTVSTTYVIAIVDDVYVSHVYYGKKIDDSDIAYLTRKDDYPFVPSVNKREQLNFIDKIPLEYPSHGVGDFREDCIEVKTLSGHTMIGLKYCGYDISECKPMPDGLPATFSSRFGESLTLKIYLFDRFCGIKVTLFYTIFEDSDAIARRVEVNNIGKEAVYLTKVYSACIDMDNRDYELLTLNGAWARERHIQRCEIGYGYQGVSSSRGVSSHQNHPFVALVDKTTTYDNGDVYAMNFIYSGSFTAGVLRSHHNSVRMLMGINERDFEWKLCIGDCFISPEVICVYSDEGLGKMSRTFHDLYRNHLIRSSYRNTKRPILINNWEATYFDFDEEKIYAIAEKASSLGIEMLVMDDGWFGNRNDDNSSLGDWFVNEKKIKGGLGKLVERINSLGMKFGIWFEPEMVSPDSELYRKHPDWVIAVPGRELVLSRNQLVLDITRKEVRECILNQIREVLKNANVEYIKWDMNRALCCLGSLGLDSDRQGELQHRYVLALYEMQESIISEFPYLLLENCSSGGGRFDPGMLYFSPQIWCSDDTDAIERLSVQEGTALIYPLSAMGAHISDCPNHITGRVTPFETRGYVALAGTFGYELDVTRISEEDRNMIPSQCEMYHRYNEILREGDYFRLTSYADNGVNDSYMVVSKDKSEAVLNYIRVMNHPAFPSDNVRLKGLDAKKKYYLYRYNVMSKSEEKYMEQPLYGSTLMNAGILIYLPSVDYVGILLHIVGSDE